MSNFPCPTALICPCAPTPFRNFSAEKPDIFDYFALAFFAGDPPLNSPDSFWTIPASVAPCESVVSQQDARDCATRTVRSKVWDAWVPDGTHGVPVHQFFNAQQVCVLPCATGEDPFVYTLPAGTVVVLSQAEADDLAASICLFRAHQAKVCVPKPPDPGRPTVDPLEWWTFQSLALPGAIHGTPMSVAGSIVPGIIGNGFEMTSTQSYDVFNFPNSIHGVTSSTFNVTLWAKWNAFNVTEAGNFTIALVDLEDIAGGSAGEITFRWFSSTQRFQVRIADEFGAIHVTQNFLPAFVPVLGQWYMLTFSYDGTTGKGGIEVYGGSSYLTTGAYVETVPPGSAVVHGNFIGGVPTQAGDIVIDELAFWNYNLSAANKTFLYHSAAGRTWPY